MQDKHQEILDKMVQEYEAVVNAEEQKLIDYALEHNLELSLGDYGTGRVLLLEDNSYFGKDRGEWLYSSENC